MSLRSALKQSSTSLSLLHVHPNKHVFKNMDISIPYLRATIFTRFQDRACPAIAILPEEGKTCFPVMDDEGCCQVGQSCMERETPPPGIINPCDHRPWQVRAGRSQAEILLVFIYFIWRPSWQFDGNVIEGGCLQG